MPRRRTVPVVDIEAPAEMIPERKLTGSQKRKLRRANGAISHIERRHVIESQIFERSMKLIDLKFPDTSKDGEATEKVMKSWRKEKRSARAQAKRDRKRIQRKRIALNKSDHTPLAEA